MLALTLAKEGYAVEAVASLAEAREMLEKKRFDLVVSDIYLNRDSGLEILQLSREREGSAPIVILITAHGSVETAAHAHAQGAFDYIAKPFDLDALLEQIRRALAAGGARESEGDTPIGLESMIVGNDAAIVGSVRARAVPLSR